MSHIGRKFGAMPTSLGNSTEAAEDKYEMTSADLILSSIVISIATIGLVANIVALILVFSMRQLQKAHNAMFLHQMVLDSIKCIYVYIFTKNLFDQKPVLSCFSLGSSYLILITVTAFNLLAITINYVYHFTNRVVNVRMSSLCCVPFGIALVWIASCVVNLGVAFISAGFDFHNEIGYCAFTYGLDGSYLLHALWIAIITAVMIVNAFYLRNLHKDLSKRSYRKIAQFMHSKPSVHAEMRSTIPSAPDKTAGVTTPTLDDPVISLAKSEITNPLAESIMLETSRNFHGNQLLEGKLAESQMEKLPEDQLEMLPDSQMEKLPNSQMNMPPESQPELVNGTTDSQPYITTKPMHAEYSRAISTESRHSTSSQPADTVTSEDQLLLTATESTTPPPQAPTRDLNELRLVRVQRVIANGRQHLYILVAMLVMFVAFWYPLFLVTAVDVNFKAGHEVYKNLIRVGWLHCVPTPFLFILFNWPYIRKKKNTNTGSLSGSLSSVSEITQIESDRTHGSVPRPGSFDLPRTPTMYSPSELSYQVVYTLLDENISPSIISHMVDLQRIKHLKRRMTSSRTCPGKLGKLRQLSPIEEIRCYDSDVDLSEAYERRQRNGHTARSTARVHRISTGCVYNHKTASNLQGSLTDSTIHRSAITWL